MAILKVIFPHHDDEGNWLYSGDYREVPDHLVDFYLRPNIQLGVVALAMDPEVWSPSKPATPNDQSAAIHFEPVAEDPVYETDPAPVEGGDEQAMVEPEAEAEEEAPAKKRKK